MLWRSISRRSFSALSQRTAKMPTTTKNADPDVDHCRAFPNCLFTRDSSKAREDSRCLVLDSGAMQHSETKEDFPGEAGEREIGKIGELDPALGCCGFGKAGGLCGEWNYGDAVVSLHDGVAEDEQRLVWI